MFIVFLFSLHKKPVLVLRRSTGFCRSKRIILWRSQRCQPVAAVVRVDCRPLPRLLAVYSGLSRPRLERSHDSRRDQIRPVCMELVWTAEATRRCSAGSYWSMKNLRSTYPDDRSEPEQEPEQRDETSIRLDKVTCFSNSFCSSAVTASSAGTWLAPTFGEALPPAGAVLAEVCISYFTSSSFDWIKANSLKND